MIEIVLSILLAAASAVGVVFWRKAASAKAVTRRQVEELRSEARAENASREAVIEANLEDIDKRLDDLGDSRPDRSRLADLLNSD